MQQKSLRILIKSAAYIIAALGLLTGILGVLDGFDLVPLPEGVKRVLYIVISLLVVALIVVAILLVGGFGLKWVSRWFSSEPGYYVDMCSPDDVEQIAQMASEMFGPNATPVARTHELHALDSEIFRAIRGDQKQLCGYVCMIRLSRAGLDAAMNDDFDVVSCPADYIRTDGKKKYSDIYIGALYGTNRLAKHTALGATLGTLQAWKARWIFARAATDDGVRILDKYEFKTRKGNRPEKGSFCRRKGIG